MGSMSSEEQKQAICAAIDEAAPFLCEIADTIHSNPELGFKEVQSSKLLVEALERFGAKVDRGVAGMDTAFLGRLSGRAAHPCVGLVCEYDALPNIGHACGHNLIGTSAVAAVAGLKAVAGDLPGTIVVMGSPAEEGGGGKIFLLERGALDDVDVALGVHPRSAANFVATQPGTGGSLARAVLHLEFFGKAAHAAVNPHDGINALDAMIQFYNGVAALRQQLRSDTRIHGVITHGGDAPNVIPDHTAARFYIRARDIEYMQNALDRVKNVAEGAALQTGCRVEMSHPDPTYEDTRPNLTLGKAFRQNMEALGMQVETTESRDAASTDFGNISQRKPAVSAKFSIVDERVPGHSVAFRDAAGSEYGRQAMLRIAKAYALTAYDVLTNPALFEAAKAEFAGATM